MSTTIRIILILGSIFSLVYSVKKLRQSKLKVNDLIGWIIGSIVLILMSIFADAIVWVAAKVGIESPANLVFLVFIAFLLMQVFIDNIKISELNEKVKTLDHHLALKEKEERDENINNNRNV